MVITLLTDFGLREEWVGVVKGVIHRINPHARVIDICNEIPSYDIGKGALVLRAAVPYMPIGIHLAIVDPGVGTGRRALAIKTGRGDYLVGPDNGLLLPASEALAGIAHAVEIRNESYLLHPVAPTFHGRDVFAPVAAHLAQGVDIANLGPSLKAETLQEPPWGQPHFHERRILMKTIDEDKFGTLRFNVTATDWQNLKASGAPTYRLSIGHKHFDVPMGKSFGDVAPGKPLLLLDSSGYLALAVNRGSAAQTLEIGRGQIIELSWPPA